MTFQFIPNQISQILFTYIIRSALMDTFTIRGWVRLIEIDMENGMVEAAQVMRMIRKFVGDEVFDRAIKVFIVFFSIVLNFL